MTSTVSPALGDEGYPERPEPRIVTHKAREIKDDGRYIILYTFGNTPGEDDAREEGEY